MIHETIPYNTIDWTLVPGVEHKGATGMATWKTMQYPGLRIRLVRYSAGYEADHWCRKGHIVHCLDGTFVNELQNGNQTVMSKGKMYVVSDEASVHRSISENGALLLIIDGDFLK